MGSISVSGVSLDIEERGAGRPLLFLHAGEGLAPERPWLDLLARRFRVIAPSHPGFGDSALPDWVGSVDDLAYLYLDLAAALDLRDAVLVGRLLRRLDRRRNGGARHARFRAAGAGRSGRHQGGRRYRARHRRHARAGRAEFMRLAWADPRARRDRYDRSCRRPSWRRSRAGASRWWCSAGSLTCTIRG